MCVCVYIYIYLCVCTRVDKGLQGLLPGLEAFVGFSHIGFMTGLWLLAGLI